MPDSTKAAGGKEKNQSNEVGSTRDCKEKEQINNLRYKLQLSALQLPCTVQYCSEISPAHIKTPHAEQKAILLVGNW